MERAEVEALVAQFAQRLQVFEEQQGGSKATRQARELKLLTLEPTAAPPPVLVSLDDIVHRADNPVKRPVYSLEACALVDLELERGFQAVAKQQNRSVLHEYRHWASITSYFWDAYHQAVVQCSAAEIPAPVRQRLAVCLTALRECLFCSVTRLDFLKLLGEKDRFGPGVVNAVEATLNLTQGLPISSTAILEALQSFSDKKVTHLTKAGAVEAARAVLEGSPSRPGGGRGSSSRGRGAGGRGRQGPVTRSQSIAREDAPTA